MNEPFTKQAGSLKLYPIAEVQEMLSVSRPTLLRLLKVGHLKTVRVGRAVRVPESSIAEFIGKGGERHIEESK